MTTQSSIRPARPVQGHAVGGALLRVVGCDVVVAGSSARFGSAFTRASTCEKRAPVFNGR